MHNEANKLATPLFLNRDAKMMIIAPAGNQKRRKKKKKK